MPRQSIALQQAQPLAAEYVSDIQLARRYSVSRGTIWRWARVAHIPQPIKLSTNISRWKLSEVIDALGA